MPHSQALRTLAHLMIGLAWEDGEVTIDEMNLLKDILFHLPEITPEDWREMELYWLSPINHEQLTVLGQQFIAALKNNDDKKACYDVLLAMAQSDGRVTSEETALLREVSRGIDRADMDVVEDLGKLLQSALPKRAERLSYAANREDYMQDYMENHVFGALKHRYGDAVEARLGLDEAELRKFGLTGALMGLVAYADYEIDDQELMVIDHVLQKDWSLRPEHAAVVLEYAVDAANQQLDDARLMREFYESTSLQERIDFLDILFDIAQSHNGISPEETAEIGRIARLLKIPYADFEATRERAARMAQLILT